MFSVRNATEPDALLEEFVYDVYHMHRGWPARTVDEVEARKKRFKEDYRSALIHSDEKFLRTFDPWVGAYIDRQTKNVLESLRHKINNKVRLEYNDGNLERAVVHLDYINKLINDEITHRSSYE